LGQPEKFVGLAITNIIATNLTTGRGQVVLVSTMEGGVEGSGGLFRSEDSGATGTQISTHELVKGSISSLVADPGNPSRVYAALPGLGIFLSEDAGVTWQQLSTGIPTLAGSTRIELAVHRNSAAGTNAIYAAVIGAPTSTLTRNAAAGALSNQVNDPTIFEMGDDLTIDATPAETQPNAPVPVGNPRTDPVPDV